MPPSADVNRSSSGDLSLQLGGFGVGGKRQRNSEELDVLIRRAGVEGWSAATVLAFACEANKRVYPNDPARPRDALIELRDRLLRPTAPTYASVQPARVASPSQVDRSFTALRPQPTTGDLFPSAARRAGVNWGSAQVDCLLSREKGMSDCRIISETPSGLASEGRQSATWHHCD